MFTTDQSDRRIGLTAMGAATAAVMGAIVLCTSPGQAQDAAAPNVEGTSAEADNGTDPRDFGNKFMPYSRFTTLDNGADDWQLTAFGMIDMSDTIIEGYPWAITYEMPIVQYRDIGDALPAGSVSGGGGFGQNELPLDSADEVGVGDLNLRAFGPVGQAGKFNFLAGVELFIPTASEDLLGSGKFTISPIFVPMYAGGPNWFIAPMIFPYRTDFAGQGSRGDIDLTLCRCFAMYAFQNGMYLLPELQPIYDWNEDEFSLYVMPEVGKILAPGRIAYIKPGYGVDPDENDREWGLELGFRYFF